MARSFFAPLRPVLEPDWIFQGEKSDGEERRVVFCLPRGLKYPRLSALTVTLRNDTFVPLSLSPPLLFSLPIKAIVNRKEEEDRGVERRYLAYRWSLKKGEGEKKMRYSKISDLDISGVRGGELFMKITRWHSRYPLPSIHEFPAERYPYAKENYGPHRSTPGV